MVAILKHIEIEGPGLFGGHLKQAGFKTKIFELAKGDALPSLDKCEAILIMGGPMNVYETDKYPFLLKEEEFLREAIAKKIPVLGICLGAQILAKISGAKVYKSEKKEIGWYRVALTESGQSDKLFKGIKGKFSVFQWHEDTFDIPKSGVHLVEGDSVDNQAFRVGECAWGLQFHPEMISQLIKVWVDRSNEPLNKSSLLFGYFKFQDLYLKQARIICNNFSKIITKQSKSGVSV
jgi:GMP synthase-like glutamine amidotransferase